MRANNSTFTWMGQIFAGLVLIGVSAQTAWIFHSQGLILLLGCGLVFLLSVGIIIYAEWRERPRRNLRKVRSTLHFSEHWQIKFDKKIGRKGVAPIALIRPDGVRFVVEICFLHNVSWAKHTAPAQTTEINLVQTDGNPVQPDLMPNLLSMAQASSAAPVLWLPLATTPKNLRHPDSNLMVVMGTAQDLKHALQSAEIVPIRNTVDTQSPQVEQQIDTEKSHKTSIQMAA
jgi:hypothetical protein